jgi:hypothetical protein
LEDSESLYRLQAFVKTALSEFHHLTTQLKQKASPHHLGGRLILLPEAVKRVIQCSEDDLICKVEQFLSAEFKSS